MTATNGLDPLYPYLGGNDNPSGRTDHGNPGGGVLTEPAGRPLTPTPYFLYGGGTDTVLGGLAAVPPSGDGFEPADPGAFGEDPSGGVTLEPDGSIRISGENEQAGAEATTSGQSPAAFPS